MKKFEHSAKKEKEINERTDLYLFLIIKKEL